MTAVCPGRKRSWPNTVAQRFQYAGVGEWLLRRERCQLLKLRRRFQRPIAVRRDIGGEAPCRPASWRRPLACVADGATESGIDLGGERGGASRFQPGVSQPQRLGPGGLRQKLRQCPRRTPVGQRSRPRDRPGRGRASNEPRRDRRRARRCGSSPAAARCARDRPASCADQRSWAVARSPCWRAISAARDRTVASSPCSARSSSAICGRFVQFAQLQQRASEAGAGAGRGIAGEATLPAGADPCGVARRKRQGGSLVQKRGGLAGLLLDQVKQLRGVVELTADTEPCRKLEAKFGRQRAGFGEGDIWFVKRDIGEPSPAPGAASLERCTRILREGMGVERVRPE